MPIKMQEFCRTYVRHSSFDIKFLKLLISNAAFISPSGLFIFYLDNYPITGHFLSKEKSPKTRRLTYFRAYKNPYFSIIWDSICPKTIKDLQNPIPYLSRTHLFQADHNSTYVTERSHTTDGPCFSYSKETEND